MGACGCVEMGEHFKLKAPEGYYVIQLIQGCDYCCNGSEVRIHHPEATKWLDDVEYMPDLPVLGEEEVCYTVIKCGLNPDEMRKVSVEYLTISELDKDQKGIDEFLAEELGKDLWSNALSNSPTVIQNIGDGI